MDRIMQAGAAGTQARREELRIARGNCRLVRRASGGVLGVHEGRVLMTVEGDPQDYWLEPGEALPFAPGERVWVGGWDEAVRCELCTSPALLGERCARVLLGWLARWAARAPKRFAHVRMRALRG
ncbi:DUF2917 domain-containing protein [Paraburkholderia sacchari]|uniref:DUF2917 domain-containing protein n=1 Tax=Paraburkholderia sacchari TaxID=159450 RepID=UPI0039A4ECDD